MPPGSGYRTTPERSRLAAALFIANFVGGFVQIGAFAAGIERWLGYPWIVGFALFFPINTAPIAASIVAYYGATQAWHWEWWQAALLCWPFLILGGFMLSVGLLGKAR